MVLVRRRFLGVGAGVDGDVDVDGEVVDDEVDGRATVGALRLHLLEWRFKFERTPNRRPQFVHSNAVTAI